MKFKMMAAAMLVITLSGYAQSGGSMTIGEGTFDPPSDVSARSIYTVYDDCGQVVAELRVHNYEEVLAFIRTLPAGNYWVEEKKKDGTAGKRRIIVYTTTS